MNFEDHYAIERLRYQYPEYADSGDFDAVGKLFAHCDHVHPDGSIAPAMGAKDYAAYYASIVRRYPDTGTPKTRHVVSNVAIEYDGAPDRAKAHSYFTVLQQTDELGSGPITGNSRDGAEFGAGLGARRRAMLFAS